MSIPSAVFKGITYVGKGVLRVLGFIGTAGEFISAGRQLAKAARQGNIPLIDDTEPIPLSRSPRQVLRQPTILPPRAPKK